MKDPGLGKNHGFTKRLNRQTVLGLLRRDPSLSRAEIARLVQLSPQAVSNITQDLWDGGLVVPAGKVYGGKGQPPTSYRIAADCGFGIGLHLDRTAVRAVLIDFAYAERAQIREPLTDPSEAGVRGTLRRLVDGLIAAAGVERRRVWGVGIASPRLRLDGEELDSPLLEGEFWSRVHGYELDRGLAEDTGLAVIVENDANAGALGELTFGRGVGLQHFCYLFLGHGLGGGLVQNGAIYRGGSANAGEVGRILVRRGEETLYLESILSLEGLLGRIAPGEDAIHDLDLSLPDLIDGARAATEAWIEAAADHLRGLVATLENTLDPQTILIGSDLPPHVLDRLVERAHPLHPTIGLRRDRVIPRLQAGLIGTDVIALGAATTPLLATLDPDPAATWTIRGRILDLYEPAGPGA